MTSCAVPPALDDVPVYVEYFLIHVQPHGGRLGCDGDGAQFLFGRW